jgi:hypothetical protein
MGVISAVHSHSVFWVLETLLILREFSMGHLHFCMSFEEASISFILDSVLKNIL